MMKQNSTFINFTIPIYKNEYGTNLYVATKYDLFELQDSQDFQVVSSFECSKVFGWTQFLVIAFSGFFHLMI